MKVSIFKPVLTAYAQRNNIEMTESAMRIEYQKWRFNGHAPIADAAFRQLHDMLEVMPKGTTHISFNQNGLIHFHKIEVQTYMYGLTLGYWEKDNITIDGDSDFIAIHTILKGTE